MGNFAVIDGEDVLNIILAESKEIAEQITGKQCLEFTTEQAEPGGTYVNETFIPRKPFLSWILNEENVWEAPIAYPEVDPDDLKHYTWDELTTSWVQV
jgi:hypothetical protein